jgi:hypothetical protein
MQPNTPRHSPIPCYAPDGTSFGYRTLDAAQRLVSGGYVRPSYGRKGHLRAIWLLRDDGSSPVQPRAQNGTRYSYIESLATGRCWRLRRLDRNDAAGEDGATDHGARPVPPGGARLSDAIARRYAAERATRLTVCRVTRWRASSPDGVAMIQSLGLTSL